MSAIVAVARVVRAGAYNPYTPSGALVVNGVLASCHSAWLLEGLAPWLLPARHAPALYQAVLAPVRAAHALAPAAVRGLCARFAGDARALSDVPLRELLGAVRASVLEG